MALTNPEYLVDETFVGLDISAGASICTYDVLADALVTIEAYVTVAGGDEYTVWLTRKWGGVGVAHEIAPLTVIEPTGTDLSFTSIPVWLKTGDQIAVMVDGLAGDNAVSGGVRIMAWNYSLFDETADEVICGGAEAGCVEFTYTVTDISTGLPIEGVDVWFTTDAGGTNLKWRGTTDAFGVARDTVNNLPCLDSGTYYVWRNASGYTFDDPDTEVVSDP